MKLIAFFHHFFHLPKIISNLRVVVLSTEGYEMIYYLSPLNILVSCCFIMFMMYIRKTSWKQDQIKDRHDHKGKHDQPENKSSKCQQSSRVLGINIFRKFLGLEEHLDWLKINRFGRNSEEYKNIKNIKDIKKIKAQEYKDTKSYCGWKCTYAVLTVIQKGQSGKEKELVS